MSLGNYRYFHVPLNGMQREKFSQCFPRHVPTTCFSCERTAHSALLSPSAPLSAMPVSLSPSDSIVPLVVLTWLSSLVFVRIPSVIAHLCCSVLRISPRFDFPREVANLVMPSLQQLLSYSGITTRDCHKNSILVTWLERFILSPPHIPRQFFLLPVCHELYSIFVMISPSNAKSTLCWVQFFIESKLSAWLFIGMEMLKWK